jgi:hypothetical protein
MHVRAIEGDPMLLDFLGRTIVAVYFVWGQLFNPAQILSK